MGGWYNGWGVSHHALMIFQLWDPWGWAITPCKHYGRNCRLIVGGGRRMFCHTETHIVVHVVHVLIQHRWGVGSSECRGVIGWGEFGWGGCRYQHDVRNDVRNDVLSCRPSVGGGRRMFCHTETHLLAHVLSQHRLYLGPYLGR